jgi:alcohol dehydrogenase class IV
LGHSTGHALGAIFHVPHGRAVGLFLPYTMEYLFNSSPETTAKFAQIGRFCGLGTGSDKDCAKALIAKIRTLAAAIGQPLSVWDCGIDKAAYIADIPDLVDRAINEVMTITVTRVPDTQDLEKIFLYAYDGKSIDF